MHLLNIDKSTNLDRFKQLFQKLENKVGLNFIFVYGYEGKVSPNYIGHAIKTLREQGEISIEDNRPIFPIVIGGYLDHRLINAESILAPAFSHSYEFMNTIPRIDVNFIELKVLEGDIKLLPILSPTEHVYGNIYIPPKKDAIDYNIDTDFPIMFINYNLFGIETTESWDKMFKYLVSYGLSLVSSSQRKPRWTEDFTVSGIEQRVNSLSDTLLKNVKDKLLKCESDISSYKSNLLSKLREFKDLKSKLHTESSTDHIIKQFKLINEMESVKWADITDKYLRVLTDQIEIETGSGDNKRIYHIGNILMQIEIETGKVYFDNVSRRVEGHACNNASHPHDASRGDNQMCLGEIDAFIPELLQQMELAALVELLINFAQSVNLADSAGKTIRRWEVK